jgi:hypothetical protein
MIPHDKEYEVIKSRELDVDATATHITAAGFTAAELAAATRAVLSVHDGDVHYLYDGQDPTDIFGIHMSEDQGPHVVWGTTQIGNLKFVRDQGASTARLTIILETVQGTYTPSGGGTTTTAAPTTTTAAPTTTTAAPTTTTTTTTTEMP